MMRGVDAASHLDHARRAGEAIAEAAEGHLGEAVPSCPEYDVGSLLLHTGGFCRFVRESILQDRAPDLDFSGVGDDALAWHRREHEALVATLEASDPEAPGWSWGRDRHLRFWFRRAAQELAVHRWDVECASGEARPIDPRLAADGVDELLDEFGPPPVEYRTHPGVAAQFGGDGETMHLHATDLGDEPGGEWLVTARPDHFEVERVHAKGDVAVRGTASDLLLLLWGRLPHDGLETFGEVSLLHRWRDRVAV